MNAPVSHPPVAGSQAVTSSPPKPRLLDQLCQAIRARHYSERTERSYIEWIKRFIFFFLQASTARDG